MQSWHTKSHIAAAVPPPLPVCLRLGHGLHKVIGYDAHILLVCRRDEGSQLTHLGRHKDV